MTTPRFVSLVPSLTETLFAFGVGDRVVGATKFCVRPQSGADHVARIGGTKDPRIEAILELEPTLVLANQEENRREDVEALRRAGVPVLVTYPRRVSDVAPMLREVGAAVGAQGEAQGHARDLEEVLEGLVRAAPGAATCSPPRFLVLIWRGPWMAASLDTFLSDLLVQAGGENAHSRLQLGQSGSAEGQPGRYPEVTAEQIAEMAPDVVLLPSEPYPFRDPHGDELVRCARIERPRIVFCDGELLTWHGVRTATGLRAARDWLFPTAP